jgi:hypothetical protein
VKKKKSDGHKEKKKTVPKEKSTDNASFEEIVGALLKVPRKKAPRVKR